MATASNLTLFYITTQGERLGRDIAGCFPDAACERFSPGLVKTRWVKGGRLVFIMASGIVVRTIAPLLKDKRTDPAVIVLDEKGEHAVSLVSGHLGGANALAKEIARLVGGQPVITTASDVSDLPALDLWAEEQDLTVDDWPEMTKTAAKLVNRRFLKAYSEIPLDLPAAFLPVHKASSADIIITHWTDRKSDRKPGATVLRPKDLVVGIGCNSGTPADEIEQAVKMTLYAHELSFLSLGSIATIDKKGKEPGLVAFAEKYHLPVMTFTSDEINRVPGIAPSEAARKATGAQAVAEPAALLASSNGTLLVQKQKIGNVTVAIAEKWKDGHKPGRPGFSKAPEGSGKVYVVGTGPGSVDHLTPRARKTISDSDVIVGYGTYLDLIKGLTKDKTIVSTGMTQEIDRCRRAIELAEQGKTVAVISGGDPGIFAMAGLVLELLEKNGASFSGVTVEIIPGISALNACAARLGAPLMHDFAAISLSDRLTPWKTIEVRLDAAAAADFVIVLYNPKSKGRSSQIERARDVLVKYRPSETPVGIVKAAMRDGEVVIISDLAHMPFDQIDMQTTVVIGNSRTRIWNNFLITPRGYEQKKTW
jgi:cobalt-precorrin 5A hydrolase / precorrin-3B C17-methyltransferase